MSQAKHQILVGCDPEVFVWDLSGQFVSAHGMIPGTKKEPFKVNKGAVQVDGMALEFNIDPAHSQSEFVGNVLEVYHQLAQMVPGYNLAIEPVAVFEKGYFDRCPPEAKLLGCDPDYNAYTGRANSKPETKEPFRTAAGHIHIGDDRIVSEDKQEHFSNCVAVVRQMDWYLGGMSLSWDKDVKRRGLYGRAGAFRMKPYGVEYRPLSNAWLRTPQNIAWVYDATIEAVTQLFSGNLVYRNPACNIEEVVNENRYDWLYTKEAQSLFSEHLSPPPGY